MNVLSIDWDYFFPDTFPFDWGHSERNTFMLDAIWTFRTNSFNLKTREPALETFVPDEKALDGFWKRVCPKDPSRLVITDSHKDIILFLDSDNVYNFDAHHDCYIDKDLNCGSWVKFGFEDLSIQRFIQVYPSWRSKSPDSDSEFPLHEIHFEIPDNLPLFDLVFICRSSAWTPPWWDHKWLEFVNYWKSFPFVWNNRIALEYVEKKRSIDRDQAIKLRDQFAEELKRIQR